MGHVLLNVAVKLRLGVLFAVSSATPLFEFCFISATLAASEGGGRRKRTGGDKDPWNCGGVARWSCNGTTEGLLSKYMKKKVYIETTIFSFYHDQRKSADVVARRDWTRQWWNGHRAEYEIVTSTAVFAELEQGTLPHKADALRMARELPAIPVDESIQDIVAVYVERHVMPGDPAGDALHLALASVEKCDYLLTWNCRHLANANKFTHVRTINTLLGLHVPFLVTPLELMGGPK